MLFIEHMLLGDEMGNITAYHGTKSCCVNGILKENFSVKKPKKNDNHWLGHGVYFFEEYELAYWWAKTKVLAHNRKYGESNYASVIEAEIIYDRCVDLDTYNGRNIFFSFWQKYERKLVKEGIVLDFSMGEADKQLVQQRKRCFALDCFKKEMGVDVLIYSFTKKDPAYERSKYNFKLADIFGLDFRERQICVTMPENIMKRRDVTYNDYQEVII